MKLSVSVLCVLLLAAPLWAEDSAPKIMAVDTLDANAWSIPLHSRGVFVEPIGGLWNGPYNYIFGAGLWFATVDSGNRKLIARGYDCGSGGSEFGPINPFTEDWSNYLTDTLARVYLSTDPVDTSQWPLRNGGQPVILSEQDSYCKYSDQNPQFYWGSVPVNVVVEQRSFAWSNGSNNDIVYYIFKVKNKNDYQLDSCYLGVGVDCDIGNEAGSSANDRSNFDWERKLGFQFQTTPEPSWPLTGVVGIRLLKTPDNNMGYEVSVVDNQYSHSVPLNAPLGLTSFKIMDLSHSPTSEESCYLAMSGYDFLGSVLDAYDEWGTGSGGDKRFILSSGPFNLSAYDSINLAIVVLGAADTLELKALSDSAQLFYDTQLGVIGYPSISDGLQDIFAQNLPNPFRQQTTIRYQLTRPGLASLRVYNVTGQLVRTLVSSAMPAGRHSATWDGRDECGRKVSAGVYLYQLQAGDRALTRNMVLVK